MTTRTATCACRALSIATRGEPIKISACHCLSCRRRTGSAFSVAVFFDRDQTTQSGPSNRFVRLGDSGQPVEFHFCPTCGTSLFWYPAFRPGWVGVAIGCFEDADQLTPTQTVYEQHRLSWVTVATPAPRDG
jgi:hypothetical protein